MNQKPFPVIDPAATGRNILRLRKERGLTVKEIQAYFGFEEPRAIYKWQKGETLPTVDNLYALSVLLEVSMEEILAGAPQAGQYTFEQQAGACCSHFIRLFWVWRNGGVQPFSRGAVPRRCGRALRFFLFYPYTAAQGLPSRCMEM